MASSAQRITLAGTLVRQWASVPSKRAHRRGSSHSLFPSPNKQARKGSRTEGLLYELALVLPTNHTSAQTLFSCKNQRAEGTAKTFCGWRPRRKNRPKTQALTPTTAIPPLCLLNPVQMATLSTTGSSGNDARRQRHEMPLKYLKRSFFHFFSNFVKKEREMAEGEEIQALSSKVFAGTLPAHHMIV